MESREANVDRMEVRCKRDRNNVCVSVIVVDEREEGNHFDCAGKKATVFDGQGGGGIGQRAIHTAKVT